MTRAMITSALEHAGRGWRVVPLWWIQRDGSCSCQKGSDCPNTGKHPRINEWQTACSSDKDVIGKWWVTAPRANVGIATGRASGFWVLDVDPRHGGDETVYQLEREHGSLPETVEAVTGGGGRHIFFLMPEEFDIRNIQAASDNASPLGVGLDIRGTGGQVVGPGSTHSSGRRYEWEVEHHPDTTPIAAAPEWLLSLVRKATAPKAEGGAAAPPMPEKIPHGKQHSTLVSLAGTLRRRGMTAEEIEEAIWAVNTRRCEKPGTREAIREIARTIARYAPAQVTGLREMAPPPSDDEAPPDRGLAPMEVGGPANGVRVSRNGREERGRPLIAPLVTISAAALLQKEIPPARWAVPDLIPEGATLLAGRPKLGKSWLALQIAIAVATGGRALGKIEVEQGPVLYLALEDTDRRLQGRLRILLEDGERPEHLHLCQRAGCPPMDAGGGARLKEWLTEFKEARLVIIDTFAIFRAVTNPGRNAYEEDYRAMTPIKALADEFGVSHLIVTHQRKGAAVDVFDTVSGSLGLTGAADGTIVLERKRGEYGAELRVTGRDVEERAWAVQWDNHAAWTLMGEAEEFRRTSQDREVLALFSDARPFLRARDVSESLGIPAVTARSRLWRMVGRNLLAARDGQYFPGQAHYQTIPNTATGASSEIPQRCNAATASEQDPFVSTDWTR